MEETLTLSDNDRRKLKRKLCKQAFQHPKRHYLTRHKYKPSSEDSASHTACSAPSGLRRSARNLAARQQSSPERSSSSPEPDTDYCVLGETERLADDIYGTTIRRNVKLIDDKTLLPILERFTPHRDHLRSEARAAAIRGRNLYSQLIERSRDSNAGARALPGQERNRFSLGIWYVIGNSELRVTSGTKDVADPETAGSDEAIRFLLWLKSYVQDYVQPIVDSKGQGGLCREFKESLGRRAVDCAKLAKAIPSGEDVCHPLYSTCAVFQGFTGGPHRDTRDASPNILLNFGFARLFLPEYRAVVDLNPGEFVFLKTSDVFHFTRRHPGCHLADNERWAISCFFQQYMHTQDPIEMAGPSWDFHRRVRQIMAEGTQSH